MLLVANQFFPLQTEVILKLMMRLSRPRLFRYAAERQRELGTRYWRSHLRSSISNTRQTLVPHRSQTRTRRSERWDCQITVLTFLASFTLVNHHYRKERETEKDQATRSIGFARQLRKCPEYLIWHFSLKLDFFHIFFYSPSNSV